ncbi:hypothetical protein D9M69_614690 [compost metagenome]
MVFETHRVGHPADLFDGDGSGALLDHFREWATRHQGVDELTVKSVSELAQLAKRDSVVRFRLFGFVQRRP